MKQIVKNALILTAITLVSGLMLGLVYEVTKGPIAASKEKAKKEAYQTVLSEADTFKADENFDKKVAAKALADAGIAGCQVDEVVEATKEETVVGYIITTTSSEGYGGDIQVSVGILSDGTVNGIAILSISETAGLGMKATKPEFYEQFAGKRVNLFVLTKGGSQSQNDTTSSASVETGKGNDNEIDALSGATITSNAMTNAVNAAVVYFNSVMGGSASE